jgi:hypothetical protein
MQKTSVFGKLPFRKSDRLSRTKRSLPLSSQRQRHYLCPMSAVQSGAIASLPGRSHQLQTAFVVSTCCLHPPKPKESQQRTAALISVANCGTSALQDANGRCCLTLGLTESKRNKYRLGIAQGYLPGKAPA